jgi:hypothetical protein
MSAGRDFLLFVLFLVVLGFVWFYTGGPSRAISHSGWFLNPPSPLGNGEGYNIPSVPLPSATSSYSSDGSASGTNGSGSSQSLWDYFFHYRAGTGEAARPGDSPYAQYVTFYPGNTQTSDPTAEYITIQTNPQLKSAITVTGWTVESAQSGVKVAIGGASQIPFLGQANSETPVTLGPQSSVTLVTGRSPNGTSFRVNKCTGYFNQFQTFTPRLPVECPAPQDEMLRNPGTLAGNQDCQNFIQSIPQCTLTVGSIPGTVGSACQNFILNTLSYNGCITAHQSDPDFYRNQWYVYLDRSQELWANNHDAIELLDENGKLVGEISY